MDPKQTLTKSIDSAREHLCNKVAATTVENYPFSHIVVPQALPLGFLAEIYENLPDMDQYINIDATGRTIGYPDRFILDARDEDRLTLLPEGQGRFWRAVLRNLLDGRVATQIGRLFASEISNRLQAADFKVVWNTLLVADRTHYRIAPHTDSGRRIVTVLLYLPRDESLRDLGTSLYVTDRQDEFGTEPNPQHRESLDFRKVATVPFLPGHMVAFPVTGRSFHGVEPITQPDIRRDLLIAYLESARTPRA